MRFSDTPSHAVFHPRLSALCLLLALQLGTGWAQAQQAPKVSSPKPALTVSIAQLQQQTVPQTIAANGTLSAWQEAVIGAELSGLRLTEVLVNVGDRVRKGQVLARLDARMLESELAQAKAALAEAQALSLEAGLQAQRARQLQKEGFFSTAQVSQATAQEQSALARVQSAQALLQIQNLRMENTEIRASDEGIISARNAAVGSVVSPAMDLFRLVRQGRLEWRAEVTASELARVRPGAAVQITSASGAKLQGRVRSTGPVVDSQTRNAVVYVDLVGGASGTPAAALPGMFAQGEITLGQSLAQTVPQSAVVMRDGFAHVFVMDPASLKDDTARVRLTRVAIGRSLGANTELRSGLPETAQVVAQGAGFLNDGDTVRIAKKP
jgi:HlyD family secretion protein